MSEEDIGDKPHDPTPKKLEDARKKGEVVKSTDLIAAAGYGGLILATFAAGAYSLDRMGTLLAAMLAKAPALSAELQQVEQSILDLFNQLRIRIGMKDQGARDIASGVIESLTEQGMRIDQSGAYDLLVEVSASLRPVEKSGSYFVFADSRVTIKDVEQRILSTFSKQAKGVSGYPELAKAKAEQSVASMLADELASALVERID